MFPQVLKIAFLIISATGFALFLRAYFSHFNSSKGNGKGLKVIQILAVPSYLLHLYLAFVTNPQSNYFHARAAGAIVLAVTSIILFRASIAATKNAGLYLAFSKKVPGNLVQQGPYRFLRHPIYAAYIYMYWSGLLFTFSYFAFINCVLMTYVYYRAAHEEDQLLINNFGTEAAGYVKSKFKFIPWRGREGTIDSGKSGSLS